MRYSESYTSKLPNNVAALYEAARQLFNQKNQTKLNVPKSIFYLNEFPA